MFDILVKRCFDIQSNKVTLSFKRRIGATAQDGSSSDGGMEEIEVVVNDFGKTADLILKMGFVEKFYQENKRIRWAKGDIEFDIDTWPELEPYLEIEAPSWGGVDKAISEIGLNPEDKKIFSTHQVYRMKGIIEHDYKRIAFDGLVKR